MTQITSVEQTADAVEVPTEGPYLAREAGPRSLAIGLSDGRTLRLTETLSDGSTSLIMPEVYDFILAVLEDVQ